MREPIISIENVSVTYNAGGTASTLALKNINLEIYPEEYIIFFGPSGCGKSTLLYTMAGLEVPSEGNVVVNNTKLDALDSDAMVNFHRSTLGMVFQAFYLIPSISVLDNVLLPQMFHRAAPEERRALALTIMKRFDIEHLADHLPNELSGGQQQRVALCRSVINNPSILFADEPVGNLDSQASEKVMELLYELNTRDKKTIVLVTHDSRYLHYAHRVFYIKDGQVIREVTNSERQQLREEKMRPFIPHALTEFAKYYPHLEEGALKVKYLSHYLLGVAEERLQERLEKFVRQRVDGKLTASEFEARVDLAYREGGVGLYEQTAKRVASTLESVLAESSVLHLKLDKFPEQYNLLAEQITELRGRLLEDYEGHLTDVQVQRLDAAIKARLEGSLDHRQFKEALDKSLHDGGVGLHYQTAQEFGKRIEVFLINYAASEAASSEKPV